MTRICLLMMDITITNVVELLTNSPKPADQPRSYVVDISPNKVTRNRKYLKPRSDNPVKTETEMTGAPATAELNDDGLCRDDSVSCRSNYGSFGSNLETSRTSQL